MAATEEEARHLLARYARLATLCRMKAESSQSQAVARELADLANAYDRRRLRSA
jgi:hypothetical protein